MQEERTYKITCDACGYSEMVPAPRLPYEEGKTCPRCHRGKMYWVPPAEEARRREVRRTMTEERRISPAIVIVGGLGLGLAAALGIAAIAMAAPPTPPPGRANLYGKVTDAVTGEPIYGVFVVLDGLQVFTDAQGNYTFLDLDPGEYVLKFSKEGYQTLVY